MCALQVLGLFHSSYNGGVAAAAPPPLDERSNAGRALDATAEAVPTVEVTYDVSDGEDGSVAELPAAPAALFSPEWEAEYGAGQPGCDLARGSFMWRGQGFGSNVNSELAVSGRQQ